MLVLYRRRCVSSADDLECAMVGWPVSTQFIECGQSSSGANLMDQGIVIYS